jgi:hypothetical protein
MDKKRWPMNEPASVWISAFAISAGIYVNRNGIPSASFGELVALALTGLLLWWCLSVRDSQAAGHESRSERAAFFLGQAFKRMRNTKRGFL